ncbi:CDP-archaeol synthase [Methylobacterium nodulans]|uniref:CDP-archaeol synthase n=1 Tax=Methylobacterium nodulans (strain LMG 21967 / CNCM I-2342 / ORS 2060) TaxID=460265 RepID=B8IX29_METNO|nr:CDP-archaeol synthase [Methylobacterium nodulans]ACL63070.1 protein of unknown function DUF46 [Methylobacterium nodulans ORS 2060]
MSDPVALFRVLVLLAVANFAPIIATKLLGSRFSTPLDFHQKLRDGNPVFGAGKTIRGLVVSLAATALVAPLLGFPPSAGISLASLSMAGDLTASFIKRRLGLKAHAQAFGLDQIPEALLPLVFLRDRLGLDGIDIVTVVAAFIIGEVILSRILFRLGLRETPY